MCYYKYYFILTQRCSLVTAVWCFFFHHHNNGVLYLLRSFVFDFRRNRLYYVMIVSVNNNKTATTTKIETVRKASFPKKPEYTTPQHIPRGGTLKNE